MKGQVINFRNKTEELKKTNEIKQFNDIIFAIFVKKVVVARDGKLTFNFLTGDHIVATTRR